MIYSGQAPSVRRRSLRRQELHRSGVEQQLTASYLQAVQVLAKAVPDLTYVKLENEMRSRGYSIYLIAMEKDIEPTQTLVNLQGKIGCKYAVFYFLSAKPQRSNLKKRWPQSSKENLERLENAGVPMDSGVVKCHNVRCNSPSLVHPN
jgi:hypothetical protein